MVALQNAKGTLHSWSLVLQYGNLRGCKSAWVNNVPGPQELKGVAVAIDKALDAVKQQHSNTIMGRCTA